MESEKNTINPQVTGIRADNILIKHWRLIAQQADFVEFNTFNNPHRVISTKEVAEMETENRELVVLDEGRDDMEELNSCCSGGTSRQ
ncbi:geopeptide [Geotalea uraniireducens]|uniref:geopeptide n=1 Tax=Geotalea uraniireducens TaxID=351604 RepID=UPI00006AF96B|nr:geopeptide [Geotalea uraniireducens]